MKDIEVTREDDCIWLTDKRSIKQQIHLVPSQAEEIGKALINISESKDER